MLQPSRQHLADGNQPDQEYTNRDLPKMIEERSFREDLYYRLNVFPIHLPPLRERAEDVRLLVHFFVETLTARLGKHLERVDDQTMRQLLDYAWPGNVRELKNVIERAVILSQGPALEVELDLGGRNAPAGDAPLASLEEVERSHIVRALEASNWVLEGEHGAAGVLGLHPNTLRSRMKKKGITRPQD